MQDNLIYYDDDCIAAFRQIKADLKLSRVGIAGGEDYYPTVVYVPLDTEVSIYVIESVFSHKLLELTGDPDKSLLVIECDFQFNEEPEGYVDI